MWQASELHRDPRQDEVEEELVREKNTLRSQGGRPMSSTLSRGGVSNAKYECGFLVSPHINRTINVRIEEVRAEVRALDQKFITMQSSLDAVMAKLGIIVAGLFSAPSRGKILSNVDKWRSNSRKIVSPIARSMSKEHVSKILDFGSAGENPIILSTEIPCGSQKASSGHEEPKQVWNLK